MRVAVMQPYFVPYAGYFRLFPATDLFVALDCVQFPRRGWVHRNRLPDANGIPQWLTLPLRKTDRDTAIRDQRFTGGAREEMRRRMRRFPCLRVDSPDRDALVTQAGDVGGDVVGYLLGLLETCTQRLDLPFNVVRSSSLDIDPGLRADARIRAILKAVGGTAYVNAPGGRSLYRADPFRKEGISLDFLTPYAGDRNSILGRLLNEDAGTLRREIIDQTIVEPAEEPGKETHE